MRAITKRLIQVLACVLLFSVLACQAPPRPAVAVAPELEAAFARSEGWIGADAVYSVGVASDRILWLFGDTLIGKVEGGRRLDVLIVNNTVAVQRGPAPREDKLTFHAGRDPDGSPAALIRPADGRGWFWIYDGIQTARGLYLFLVQIERSQDNSVFGFRLAGNWLARVHNPLDPPERWRITQQRLPWQAAARQAQSVFGSALMTVGDDLYIFGARDLESGGRLNKGMLVARVALDRLEQFDSWRFYAGGRWSSAAEEAIPVCDDVANEYSVSYLPRLGKYVLVYSEGGLSPDILARLAPDPTGPWSDPIRLYRCPEAGWDARIFCYAGKGHPEISDSPGELIVSYVSNATDLALLEADARLYRPRFIRVRFE